MTLWVYVVCLNVYILYSMECIQEEIGFVSLLARTLVEFIEQKHDANTKDGLQPDAIRNHVPTEYVRPKWPDA